VSEGVAPRLVWPGVVVTGLPLIKTGHDPQNAGQSPRFRDDWVGTVSSDQGLIPLGAA
jgi:hypothetical protein